MLIIRYRYIPFVFLFLLAFAGSLTHSQEQNSTTSKQGGICFRVDDVQTANRWSEFTSIFNKYDYKACFALNLGSLLIYFPANYVDTLVKMQREGHEIMDHTPYHRTHYHIRISDTSYYSGRRGVDHIYRDTVCLSWDSVRTTTYVNEGLIDITGNIVISRTAGDFSNIDGLNSIYAIYVPSLNKIFRAGNIRNRVRTDPDTLTITSFWDERVDAGTVSGAEYHKVGMADVRMSDSAIYLLAEKSRILFDQLNLDFPKTWIQTGGPTPQFYREELKRVLEPNFGFTSGAVYPNRALKTFNEYNPTVDKQFGMQWEDFRDDIWSLQQNKTAIADRIARNYVSIGASHFDRGGALLGGWTGYVGRVDSLLMWCNENNIPVRTQSEWADILYNTPQDPTINIFPKLNVDLDKNSIPDGYYTTFPGFTDGIFDTTSGAPESGNRSYTISRTGSIAYINDLGGLEKDTNDFHIWTKGSAGSVITVAFTFPELGQTRTFTFPASTSEWTKYDLSQSTNGTTALVVPEAASYADVRISCTTYGGSPVSISGMSLKKKSSLATYTISVIQSETGVITPGTTEITEGESQIFTLTPDDGFHVDSIFVDGVYVPDSTTRFTFTNVTADHTIYARFARNTYTLNASVVGDGTITPAGIISVNHGDNQAFTVSPGYGSHADSILVDGMNIDSLLSYTFFSISGSHSITAYFSLNKYTITATAGANGSITPGGSILVSHGTDTSFSFVPADGYHADSVFVDGNYVPDSTARFTFSNVISGHTIYITFARNTYTISASVEGDGSIVPSGTVAVLHGDNQPFTVIPDIGYRTDSILVDGFRVDSLLSYTFSNISSSHTITAYLSVIEYIITATAGPNGTINPEGLIPVPHGGDTSFTFIPDFGYYTDAVFVDGLHVDSLTHYKFTNITSDHSILVNFAQYDKIGTISGLVYNDLDIDTIWSNNEPGLPYRQIDLFLNGELVESRQTDRAGHYKFKDLPAGIYAVRQQLLPGWTKTAPPAGSYENIIISSDQEISDVNFGNYQPGQYIRIPLTIHDHAGIPSIKLSFGSRIGAAYGIWGVDKSATEIDQAEGERELPPLAPNFIDARFISPDNDSELFGHGSWNDSRGFNDPMQADTYKVQTTPGPAGHPVTISWSRDKITQSYLGAVYLDDRHGTVVDMKANDSVVVTDEAITSVFIIANRPKLSFLFPKGWNLVSLPYELDDSDVNVIFPSSDSYAYIFDPKSGYLTHSTLHNGVGYWLKFLSPQDSLYTACVERLTDTIKVYEGWNLIGTISKIIPVIGIVTNPPGLIESDFFEFNAGYQSADYLEPYRGYWIKVTSDGEIILHTEGNQSAVVQPGTIEETRHALILEIHDNEKNKGNLYIDTDQVDGSRNKSMELPPVPPMEIFDLRFDSDRRSEIVTEGKEYEFPIAVSAEKYPLTLKWQNNDLSMHFILMVDGKPVPLEGNGSIQIPSDESRISVVVKSLNENVTEYQLAQNYPNPFNPTTAIVYRLPARSNVSLKIYDVLGQTVSTLVNEVQDAGIRNIEWDARGISSGLYFYRIEAVDTDNPGRSFMSVRKMMILK